MNIYTYLRGLTIKFVNSLLNITAVALKVLPLGSYAPMPAPSPPYKTILKLVLIRRRTQIMGLPVVNSFYILLLMICRYFVNYPQNIILITPSTIPPPSPPEFCPWAQYSEFPEDKSAWKPSGITNLHLGSAHHQSLFVLMGFILRSFMISRAGIVQFVERRGTGLDDRGSILSRAGLFFSSYFPEQLWGLPSLLSNGYWGQRAWDMKLTNPT
jgi:hypothetical protein